MPFGGPQKLTIAFLLTIYSPFALANIGVFVGSGNSDEASGEEFDSFLNAIEPYFPCLRKDDATCHGEVKSPYSLGLSWDLSKQDILIKDELVSDQSFLDDVTFNGQSFQNSKNSLRITAVKFGPGYGLSLTHNNFYLSLANDMGIALIAIDDEMKLGIRLSGDLGVGYRTETWGCGLHGSVEQLDFRHEGLNYEVGHVSGKYFAAVYF